MEAGFCHIEVRADQWYQQRVKDVVKQFQEDLRSFVEVGEGNMRGGLDLTLLRRLKPFDAGYLYGVRLSG